MAFSHHSSAVSRSQKAKSKFKYYFIGYYGITGYSGILFLFGCSGFTGYSGILPLSVLIFQLFGFICL